MSSRLKRRSFLAGMLAVPLATRARAKAGPLQALDADFRAGRYPGVDGMVIFQRGQMLFSASYPALRPTLQGTPGIYNYSDPDWHPLRQGLHTMQSITKTVLSALVGIALNQKHFGSVEQAVAPFFPDIRFESGLRLQDLLTMQAGLKWNEDVAYEDPLNDWAAMERSSDWLGYVLSKGSEARRFNYSSGVPMLIASMLTQVTGQSIQDYAHKELFAPLGIEHFLWKTTPGGLADCQGGLYLSTLDLARFGQLYLQKHPRLFPAAWIRESFQPRAVAEDWRYGYQWWLLPHPRRKGDWVPTALGFGGQRLFVLPRQELVAAFTGWNPGGKGALPLDRALEILTAL
jgi:CubicO group peptidase (beta-lactamase class C family)